MQRRKVIKQLVYVTGAVIFLPSCLHDKSKSSMLLKKISIDGDQEKLMADLSESIIPATDTPGAKDVSAHLFVLLMVDDCYAKEDQQKFIKGLQAFETMTKKRFNKSFINLTNSDKEVLLTDLEAKKSGDADLAYFYATFKRLTIQAYTTSKFYLTKVQVYQLVPGHYFGCVPVKNAS